MGGRVRKKTVRGFLTERQLEVLKLRAEGLSQEEVARRIGTSRANVAILEARARSNISKARATLAALKTFGITFQAVIKPGTHMVDIPRTVLDRADEANIKVKGNFLGIIEQIRFKARGKLRRGRVVKPIVVTILPDGDFLVE